MSCYVSMMTYLIKSMNMTNCPFFFREAQEKAVKAQLRKEKKMRKKERRETRESERMEGEEEGEQIEKKKKKKRRDGNEQSVDSFILFPEATCGFLFIM